METSKVYSTARSMLKATSVGVTCKTCGETDENLDGASVTEEREMIHDGIYDSHGCVAFEIHQLLGELLGEW